MRQRDFFVCTDTAFIFILVLLFLGCGNSSGTNENKDKKDTVKIQQLRVNKIKDTCLIYFENVNNLYTCCMRDLKTSDTFQLAHFSSMPMEVLWDTTKKTVYYFLQPGIFKQKYDSISIPERISDAFGDNIMFGQAWMDSASSKIRFSYLVISTYFSKEQTVKFNELTASFSSYIPGYGLGCIAYVSELEENGRFLVVEQAAGSTGAGLLEGYEGLKTKHEYIKQKFIDMNDILKAATCYKHSGDEAVEYIEYEKYKQYGIDKYRVDEMGGFILIKANKLFDIIVNTIFGDTPHYAPPVLAYDKANRTTIEMKDITQKQLGIQLKGDYVLFASEYMNSDVIVYNWKTQQKIISLKDATCGFIAKI